MVKKIITKLGSLYLFCLGMILSNQLIWKILNSKNIFLYKSSHIKLSQLENKVGFIGKINDRSNKKSNFRR